MVKLSVYKLVLVCRQHLDRVRWGAMRGWGTFLSEEISSNTSFPPLFELHGEETSARIVSCRDKLPLSERTLALSDLQEPPHLVRMLGIS